MAANWVFQFTIVTFIIGLITSPFSSLIFAYERMSVFSIISVLECVLKFILAYSLLYLVGDHLILYGFGLLIIQLCHFITYYIISKKGGGEYHYKKNVEKSLYKKMLSFSGWTLFSSSAGIGISQLVTMITNVYFGPVVNAARAIAFQVNTAMNSFTNNIIVAVRPPMIKQYAEGDYKRVYSFFNLSNKAVYYSLLLLLLPLFFEMEYVLRIWLGVEDQQTVMFCRLILCYALVLALNNPFSNGSGSLDSEIIPTTALNLSTFLTLTLSDAFLSIEDKFIFLFSGFPFSVGAPHLGQIELNDISLQSGLVHFLLDNSTSIVPFLAAFATSLWDPP